MEVGKIEFAPQICESCRPQYNALHDVLWKKAGEFDVMGADRADLAATLQQCLPYLKRLLKQETDGYNLMAMNCESEARLKQQEKEMQELSRLCQAIPYLTDKILPKS